MGARHATPAATLATLPTRIDAWALAHRPRGLWAVPTTAGSGGAGRGRGGGAPWSKAMLTNGGTWWWLPQNSKEGWRASSKGGGLCPPPQSVAVPAEGAAEVGFEIVQHEFMLAA